MWTFCLIAIGITAVSELFFLAKPQKTDADAEKRVECARKKPGWLIRIFGNICRLSRKAWVYIAVTCFVHGLAALRMSFLGFRALPMLKALISLAFCASAAAVDYRERRIPNLLVLVLAVLRLLLIPFDFLVFGRSEGIRILLLSVIGALLLLTVLFLFSVLSKGGIGMGDVKICAAVGFLSGPASGTYSVFLGIVLCGIASLVLVAVKKKALKDQVPFGPFLYLGFLICTVMGWL